MKTRSNTTPKSEIEKLLKTKYSFTQKDIKAITNPGEYAYARLSLLEAQFLASCEGKEVTIRTIYANTTKEVRVLCTKVSLNLCGGAIFTSNVFYGKIDKCAIIAAMEAGVFEIDNRNWNLDVTKGELTYPGEKAVAQATTYKKNKMVEMKARFNKY